jgi:hypothetical protein
MSLSHGKLTKITVATKDISPFTKTSTLEKTADLHDGTGYGVDDRLWAGGVRTNKFTMAGSYDNTVSVGPRNVLNLAVGTSLAIVRNVEGTGTGKPNEAFTAVLEKYVETSPFDDLVSWSADFTISGAITTTALP